MKKTLAVLAALALVLPGLGDAPPAPKKDDPGHGIMRKKLEYSQKLLEALALQDYGGVIRNADELMTLSKKAEWKVMQTPQYELYSNDFRRTLGEMTASAKDKNIDGVALKYVEMTLACVKCHKHVREVRMAAGALGTGLEGLN